MTDSHDRTKGDTGEAFIPDEMTDPVWNSLDLYFSGEASPEEVAMVERADPKLIRHAHLLWDASGVVVTPSAAPGSIASAAWKRELARLDADADVVGSNVHDASKPTRVLRVLAGRRAPWQHNRFWTILAAAAVVFVAVGVGRVLIQRHRASENAVAVTPAPRVYATQRAQRAQVRLGDGSTVTLAPESRLEVPHDFGAPRGSRIVTLVGQAYFDVVHDATQPFTVRSGNAVVRDIGTRFDVRAYGDVAERDLKVVVAEGAVVLKAAAAKDTLLLHAADAGELTRAGVLRVRRGVDVASRLAWLEGRLEFDDVPLQQVVQDLMRWYDVDIAVNDAALARYLITKSIAHERASDALNAIARVIGARVERRGSQFVIVRHHSQFDTTTPR